jgi:hypothetical protein
MNLGATQFRNLWFSENGDGGWWMVDGDGDGDGGGMTMMDGDDGW